MYSRRQLVAAMGAVAASAFVLSCREDGPSQTAATGAGTAVHPELVGAHYYAWFPDNLDQGFLRGSLQPPQEPALGRYRSDNTAVVEQHIAWCSRYGIDFLALDWWPSAAGRNRRMLEAFFAARNIADIKFCAFVETWEVGYDERTAVVTFDKSGVRNLVAWVSEIADRCFAHPSYLRVNGKPVVVFYITRSCRGAVVEAFTQVRAALRAKGYDPYLIGDEVFWWAAEIGGAGESTASFSDVPQTERIRLFDAITSYNMYEGQYASQSGYGSVSTFVDDVARKYGVYRDAAGDTVAFVPQIMPGYNDRGVRLAVDHYAIPRQWEAGGAEGSLFSELFDRIAFPFVDARVKMMFITSWNEWNEDTAIEPLKDAAPTTRDASSSGTAYTQGYSYSGHGMTYLEVVREKVVAVSGRVTDRSGAPVAGMRLRAVRDGAVVASAVSDTDGWYRFSRGAVPAGSYTVVPEAAPASALGVVVGTAGCSRDINFTLDR